MSSPRTKKDMESLLGEDYDSSIAIDYVDLSRLGIYPEKSIHDTLQIVVAVSGNVSGALEDASGRRTWALISFIFTPPYLFLPYILLTTIPYPKDNSATASEAKSATDPSTNDEDGGRLCGPCLFTHLLPLCVLPWR